MENLCFKLKFLIINNVDFIFEDCSKKLFSLILDSNKSIHSIMISIIVDSEHLKKVIILLFLVLARSSIIFF